VPVVCLDEVFRKVRLVADEARAFRAIAQMKQGRVVPLDEEIALDAAASSRCGVGRRPGSHFCATGRDAH
jgi:hypothetical protein